MNELNARVTSASFKSERKIELLIQKFTFSWKYRTDISEFSFRTFLSEYDFAVLFLRFVVLDFVRNFFIRKIIESKSLFFFSF